MTSHADTADRFAEEAFSAEPKFLRADNPRNRHNVYVRSADGPGRWPTLFSYGSHFPTAHAAVDPTGREYWLLNGDTYSSSTSKHQSDIRNAINRVERRRQEQGLTGRPIIIVPFSVISAASINKRSIFVLGSEEERHVSRQLAVATRDDVPEVHRWTATELPDGRWTYTIHDHFLGASVFSAEWWSGRLRDPKTGESSWTTETSRFVSAFDPQETQRSYFLAQLPQWSKAETHEQALEDLKPDLVHKAERDGLTVARQGDVFAVPTELSTAFLKGQPGARYARYGATVPGVALTLHGEVIVDETSEALPFSAWADYQKRPLGPLDVARLGALLNFLCPANPVTVEAAGPKVPHRAAQIHCSLYATNHYGTEVIQLADGSTFARGTITHRPEHRPSDHLRRKLGKAWHEIVLNTVPVDADGRPRAWQVSGNVD